MKKIFKIAGLFLAILTASLHQAEAQNNYFFSSSANFDVSIPSPEKFLGYAIGTHYTRHDQIVAYFRELARLTNRVHVQSIGKTYEEREQIVVTFTDPENYNRLEEIRQEHLTLVDPSKPMVGSDAPLVIHLGYSVHGNESSSGEVSLLAGYYLAANQNEETKKWLKEAVIFIDPSLNPDGRDRAANWYNAYKSFPAVSDPLDKEHNEAWPGGRTNHYYADLNRDWLNLVHVESRNRNAFFHQWYPNVQIDFHEQGSNATYYFEPSPKRHESPIIPAFIYEQSAVLAKYHAKALDDIGSLYFTKENYDNLSPIYGSTYPKFYGSIAATFEQASSGGLVKETSNGLLSFAFTIRNHLTTSFSTIKGAVAEKQNLFKAQKNLFKTAIEKAKAFPVKAYVFGDNNDAGLTQKFLDLLLRHKINAYELNDNTTADGKTFQKGTAYVLPTEQPNFFIIHSLFEENNLKDSIYYDNTGWSVIHAYGVKYAKITSADFAKGKMITSLPASKGTIAGGKSAYAYIVSYSDFNASKALYQLLEKNVLVKVAFKPFTASLSSGSKSFGYGTLVIPVAGQNFNEDSLYHLLSLVAEKNSVQFNAVSTGFSAEGIDLGSSNIKAVQKPTVALAFGQGVTSSEAGQVWFILNQHLGLPVVKIDLLQFQRADLTRFNTLILPSGTYNAWDKATVEKIKAWVSDGGTLITFKSATEWAIQNELSRDKLLSTDIGQRRGGNTNTTENQPAPTQLNRNTALLVSPAARANGAAGVISSTTNPAAGVVNRPMESAERTDYAQQQDVEGAKRINGAIFITDLDITHPLAFGVSNRKLFVNKNSTTLLQPSPNKYATIAQYADKPFINGYTSKDNIKKISNSAAIILSPSGSGRVVLFADDPTYRGYWLGTTRVFLNSIFFSNLVATTGTYVGGASSAAEEEEEEH